MRASASTFNSLNTNYLWATREQCVDECVAGNDESISFPVAIFSGVGSLDELPRSPGLHRIASRHSPITGANLRQSMDRELAGRANKITFTRQVPKS